MKITKRRWIDLALIVIIAILVFTPVMHYVKRNFFPNNTIEIASKVPLNSESLTLELKGYNTPDLALKDTKGKVTFLHFWGTWCGDCMLEMPSVQKFYEQQKDHIQFVLVDIERSHDDYSKLTKFIEKNPQYTVPMYEPNSPISTQLRVDQFPTTFIIDKEGNIVSKHEGATEWELEEVQKPILDLVKK